MDDNFKQLCDEYTQSVKYPEYGEWCKEVIFNIIKEYGVSDKKEYLTTEVFNPNSELYEIFDGNDPECVLGFINYKPQYKESLYDTIFDRFLDAYNERYEVANKELADMSFGKYTGLDILVELLGRAENSTVDLLYNAFEEIGVNGFKEYILQLV